jgi:hypothetical protein
VKLLRRWTPATRSAAALRHVDLAGLCHARALLMEVAAKKDPRCDSAALAARRRAVAHLYAAQRLREVT